MSIVFTVVMTSGCVQDKDKLQNTNSNITLVEYYADWCGFCQKQAPILDDFERRNPEIDVIRKNGEEFIQEMRTLGITGYPTILIYKDNDELGRNSGFINLNNLEKWVDEMTE